MQIDDKLLTKLEKLSNFKIDENRRKEALEELNKIVGFVEILNELELKDEEATFTTLKGGTPFRNDNPILDKDTIKTILKNAPKSEDRYFAVSKIIE